MQAALLNVDAGDLIAMKLINQPAAPPSGPSHRPTKHGQCPVGHLWNYGLNTWGWEDIRGGGDHDYNDLVVGSTSPAPPDTAGWRDARDQLARTLEKVGERGDRAVYPAPSSDCSMLGDAVQTADA